MNFIEIRAKLLTVDRVDLSGLYLVFQTVIPVRDSQNSTKQNTFKNENNVLITAVYGDAIRTRFQGHLQCRAE